MEVTNATEVNKEWDTKEGKLPSRSKTVKIEHLVRPLACPGGKFATVVESEMDSDRRLGHAAARKILKR